MDRIIHLGRLFTTASWASIATLLFILAAIIGFIVWPIVPDTISAIDYMAMIQENPVKAAILLDPVVLIVPICLISVYIAIYFSLRDIDKSLALIALALGLVSVAAFIPTRPIIELFSLSDLYQKSTSAEARGLYLAASETLLRGYHGTGWLIGNLFSASSFLISSVLMLKSPNYRRVTAWLGVVSNGGSMTVFLPVVGRLLVFFLGTIVGVVWFGLLAFDFHHLSRQYKE